MRAEGEKGRVKERGRGINRKINRDGDRATKRDAHKQRFCHGRCLERSVFKNSEHYWHMKIHESEREGGGAREGEKERRRESASLK